MTKTKENSTKLKNLIYYLMICECSYEVTDCCYLYGLIIVWSARCSNDLKEETRVENQEEMKDLA